MGCSEGMRLMHSPRRQRELALASAASFLAEAAICLASCSGVELSGLPSSCSSFGSTAHRKASPCALIQITAVMPGWCGFRAVSEQFDLSRKGAFSSPRSLFVEQIMRAAYIMPPIPPMPPMGIVRASSFTLPKRQNRISRPLIFLHFSGSI